MGIVSKAVILAGGMGTRFLPFTKIIPKEMLPVVDTPLLHLLINEVYEAGINDILVVTNKHKHILEEYFVNNSALEEYLIKMDKEDDAKKLRSFVENVNIRFVEQNEANGTGEAILLARGFTCGQPFAVLYGDDYIYSQVSATKQICDYFETVKSVIVGVQKVKPSNISLYGSVDVAEMNGRSIRINGIIEKPKPELAPSLYASLGRLVLTREIYDYLLRAMRTDKGELRLTDAINMMAREKSCYAYDFEGNRYDLGSKLGFVIANFECALSHPETKSGMEEYVHELAKKLTGQTVKP